MIGPTWAESSIGFAMKNWSTVTQNSSFWKSVPGRVPITARTSRSEPPSAWIWPQRSPASTVRSAGACRK